MAQLAELKWALQLKYLQNKMQWNGLIHLLVLCVQVLYRPKCRTHSAWYFNELQKLGNFALSGAVTASPGESTPKMKSQMECLSKSLKFHIADFTNKSGE